MLVQEGSNGWSDGQMVRIVPMRAQKMRIQMAQFEWSDGSVWMVQMRAQKMRIQMAQFEWSDGQDSSDEELRR